MPTVEGGWVVWNSLLYEALNDIHIGDRYVEDGNIKKTPVEVFFNRLKAEINTEILDRIAADNALGGRIDQEILDRQTADNALDGRIDQEILDRQGADNALGRRIDQEILDRQDSDNTLGGRIDQEILDRQDADNTLLALIQSGVSYYGTIAEFKADTRVQPNKSYLVTGYYNSGDCEIMIYKTSATATTAYKEITLDNGVYAHLVKDNDAYFNVKQYGAYGDGMHNDYNILNDIIDHARYLDNSIVYLPQGEYIIDMYLNALRTNSVTNVPRDFHNMTICGDGNTSIIHGKSDVDRFDVLQINEGCNLNIKDLALTETTNGAYTWGANGISLTNGCHDITIENVHVFDLPEYVSTYVDGGKAFTVQTGDANTLDVYGININNCSCSNTALGFEFDAPANNNIKFEVHLNECNFDVKYSGITLSFPSFGNGYYSTNTIFTFNKCNIKSRQRCVINSRTSNVYFTNCTFEQYGAPLTILPSDTNKASIEVYASRTIFIDSCVFLSSFGSNAIVISADGYTNSRAVIIRDIFIGNSFTGAAVDSINSPVSDCYIDNLHNLGASTSISTAARNAANTILNYGGYQIFNNYTMTDKASAKTLGSYTGNAIPVYNSIGSQIGWLPLYN